jgi:hypothetical protein
MRARLVLLLLLVLSVFAAPSLAHEGREVGEYEVFFGWRNEPAYAGLFNGPEVFIGLHDAPEGTEFSPDIEVELQVEAMFGSETVTLPLEAAWNETGHYLADLIPTLPGDYTFRVFGTIGDVEVDETFTSADGEFSSVEPATDVMFPTAGIIDAEVLLTRIEALEARIAELEGN